MYGFGQPKNTAHIPIAKAACTHRTPSNNAAGQAQPCLCDDCTHTLFATVEEFHFELSAEWCLFLDPLAEWYCLHSFLKLFYTTYVLMPAAQRRHTHTIQACRKHTAQAQVFTIRIIISVSGRRTSIGS